MKIIKSIVSMVLILVAVKTCFYIKNEAFPPLSGVSESARSESVPSAISHSKDDVLSGYKRHILGHGVSVEIPENWYVLTDDQVSNIRIESSRTLSDKETSLAANSSSDPNESEAQYRVSFVEKQFDDNSLRAASLEDLKAGCEDIYNMWVQNPPTPRPIGRPQCSTAMFNGKIALLTSYKRHGRLDSTWSVNIVNIPLSDKVVMITFSKMDGSAEADDMIATINSSVKF